jgi:hypothetical protein
MTYSSGKFEIEFVCMAFGGTAAGPGSSCGWKVACVAAMLAVGETSVKAVKGALTTVVGACPIVAGICATRTGSCAIGAGVCVKIDGAGATGAGAWTIGEGAGTIGAGSRTTGAGAGAAAEGARAMDTGADASGAGLLATGALVSGAGARTAGDDAGAICAGVRTTVAGADAIRAGVFTTGEGAGCAGAGVRTIGADAGATCWGVVRTIGAATGADGAVATGDCTRMIGMAALDAGLDVDAVDDAAGAGADFANVRALIVVGGAILPATTLFSLVTVAVGTGVLIPSRSATASRNALERSSRSAADAVGRRSTSFDS